MNGEAALRRCAGSRYFVLVFFIKICFVAVGAVKGGFDNVKSHITGLASKAFDWGKDLIMGIINGIKSCISAVGDAVSAVADKIRSYLHFSVPDEGLLTDYESWMPDFMKGLADGIEKSRGMIDQAMQGVTGDMIDEIVVTAQQRMNLRSGGR